MLFADRILEDAIQAKEVVHDDAARYRRPSRSSSEPRLARPKTTDVARQLTLWERISDMSSVRKLSILVVVLIAWEIYTRWSEVSAT